MNIESIYDYAISQLDDSLDDPYRAAMKILYEATKKDKPKDWWSRPADFGASSTSTSPNGIQDHPSVSEGKKNAWVSSFQRLGDTTSLSLYELWKATVSQFEHLLKDRYHMSESFTKIQYEEFGELDSMLLRLRIWGDQVQGETGLRIVTEDASPVSEGVRTSLRNFSVALERLAEQDRIVRASNGDC